MPRYQVGYFVGSLSSTSINRVLSRALIRLAPAELEFTEIPIGNLPLYSPDFDDEYPPEATALKDAIAASDAVLFVTPEYNRSIPGVLKNAIDNASRPYGQSAWAGKPAGVVGISIGAIGTALAQQHLRNVLSYLDMPVLGQPEVFLQQKPGFFADDGSIANEATRQFLQGYLERFAEWVKHHADRVANR